MIPSIFPGLVSCYFRSILPHSMHSLCVQESSPVLLTTAQRHVSVYLTVAFQFGWVCNVTWLDYSYPTNSRTARSVIICRVLIQIDRSEASYTYLSYDFCVLTEERWLTYGYGWGCYLPVPWTHNRYSPTIGSYRHAVGIIILSATGHKFTLATGTSIKPTR